MRFWGPRWSDRWPTLLLVAVFVLLEVFASHQRLRVAALFAAGVAVFVCERSTRSKAARDRSEAIDAEAELMRQRAEEKDNGGVLYRGMQAKEAGEKNVRRNAADSLKGFLRLAEYAIQRGEPVEAHYWALKALLAGESGARSAMNRYRIVWKSQGCHSYHGRHRVDFTEDKANLSLAALRASCRINEIGSKNMIVHLARHGDEDALAYLNLIRRK